LHFQLSDVRQVALKIIGAGKYYLTVVASIQHGAGSSAEPCDSSWASTSSLK